ncbi:MAG: efflux RND transporter periplasmic adaptor subunit [Candidatus Paceibacterota bacterium]
MKKKFKINFKSKWFWIITIAVIVLIVVFIPKGEKAPSYETAKVEKGVIEQTVDATGKIESADKVSLNFQMSGNINRINVKEGDSVSKGQLLASISSAELDAAVAQAQASLNQKLAGSTTEQIDISQRQVDSARIAYEKAQSSLRDVLALGETSISSKYSYALTSLNDAYLKIYNAFTTATSVKDGYFNSSDQQGLAVQSVVSYKISVAMKTAKVSLDSAKAGDRNAIDTGIVDMISSLDTVYEGLNEIRNTCDNGSYKASIPDSIRTSLDSQKSIINLSKTAIVTLQSEISSLKVQNERDKNNAEAAIESAKANLDIQEANLKSIKAGPRDVDIAYYEATLSQARANRAKAYLYAPISGIISKVNKSVGELVGMSEPAIELMSPHYEIEIDIPETDVVKVSISDDTEITFDALGDVKFNGKVMTIEPNSTDIQDVVYYKIKVSLEGDDERVKPGMTANVVIKTDKKENVLFVPSRSILTDSKNGGRKYVKVLSNGQVTEKDVAIGIKGDGGFVEILSGLSEGEEVVLKTNK